MDNQYANDERVFSIFDIVIMKEMTSFVSINSSSYIAVSRFKLNKMISFDEMSLYKFITSNFKLIMIVKIDFFTQSHNVIRFREELSFRFTVNNTEWIAYMNCCDIIMPKLTTFVIRNWRWLMSVIMRYSILLSRRLSRFSHLFMI